MILKRLKLETNWKDTTNCYIIVDEDTKEALVIDPASNCNVIEEMLDTLEAKLKYIVLTHCHGDHTGAVNELRQKRGGKVLIHTLDADSLNDVNINMTDYIGTHQDYIEVDSRLNDNDLIHIGNLEFRVIHTPGHTQGRNMFILRRRKTIIFWRYIIQKNMGKNRFANKFIC